MVLKQPQVFKIAALQAVRDLFPPDWNPFYAGFGNRGTDEVSYLHVGIPAHRIFTINPQGAPPRAPAPPVDTRCMHSCFVNTSLAT